MLCCGRALVNNEYMPAQKTFKVAKEVNSVDEFYRRSTTLYTTDWPKFYTFLQNQLVKWKKRDAKKRKKENSKE